MTKPLVIYHANCADGFGAAFSAWLSLGDEAEYVALGYDAGIGVEELAKQFNTFRLVDMKGNFYVISTPEEKRDVYILDFSFKKPIMDFIFAHASRVTWLDHHKSALEMWLADKPDFSVKEFLTDQQRSFATYGNNVRIELNNWKSGAYLAWEFFHPGTEVPMLIKHIDDYDRWQFKIEDTKTFNKALWSYAPWAFAQWREMFWNAEYDEFYSVEATGLLRDGKAILRAHDQNVQSVVKGTARVCKLIVPGNAELTDHTYNGLSANCPHHLTSDVGHEIATQSGTFGLCWHLGKEGTMAKCSLRSNGDYDVSAIAKAFSGGGHRNAAGFEVPIATLLGWLK